MRHKAGWLGQPNENRTLSWKFANLACQLSYHPRRTNSSCNTLTIAVEYTDCISAEVYDPPHNDYPGYDTKQSDGEVPVMMELWWMQSTPLLPSLPGPPWLGVVAPDSVLCMCQITSA